MSRWQKIVDALRKESKISSSNPRTFEETWSFTTSRIRLISLFVLLLLVFGSGFTYLVLKGPFAGFFSKNDRSIERGQLEKQQVQIEKLSATIDEQETFIYNLQQVILGNIKPEEVRKKKNINPVDYKDLNAESTAQEKELAERVKENLKSANTIKNKEELVLFVNPVQGKISDGFNRNSHPGIDIVAKKDEVVKACSAGVILYAGYSKEDGFFIIMDHGDESQSIYKHNKVNLKKAGQRVQAGDPIAIVGNSGENSSGPHLHFELWLNQQPVNPKEYLRF